MRTTLRPSTSTICLSKRSSTRYSVWSSGGASMVGAAESSTVPSSAISSTVAIGASLRPSRVFTATASTRGNVSSGCSTTKSAMRPTVSRVPLRSTTAERPTSCDTKPSWNAMPLTSSPKKRTGTGVPVRSLLRPQAPKAPKAPIASSTSSFSTTRHRHGSEPSVSAALSAALIRRSLVNHVGVSRPFRAAAYLRVDASPNEESTLKCTPVRQARRNGNRGERA